MCVLLNSILGQTYQLYHITPGIFQERSIFLFSFHLIKHKPRDNLQALLSDHSLLYLELLSQLKIIFSINEFYVDACPGEYVTDTANMI